jgi:hypothetical protein
LPQLKLIKFSQKEKAKEMLESGMSYRTAAKELDIIPQTLRYQLNHATKFTQRTSKIPFNNRTTSFM